MSNLSYLFNLKGTTAVLSGHLGNLGPVWEETLYNAGCIVHGFDIKKKLYNVNKIEDMQQYKKNIDSWQREYNAGRKINIIINNAAIDHPPQPGINFWTDYENIIQTNLVGACNLTSVFLPDMIENGGGVIINIGSIQGNVAADWRNYEGFEKPVGYNLSKAGLVQFTRSLAVQYGKYNIRSVCISFAACDTGKFKEPFKSKFLNCLPLGRFISEESLKMTLLYAICCPELTGQQILVDAGYTAW